MPSMNAGALPTGIDMANPTISPAMLRRLRRLSLRQLIYFVELERHGGFGKAADALSISQPTLSHQIAQLEAQLGVKLVDRNTRRFVLTDRGVMLLGRVHKVLELLAGTVTEISDTHPTQPLSIGIPNYTTYPVVSESLRALRAQTPDSFPRLVEVQAEEMSQMLNDGSLDAGFLSFPTPARLAEHIESVVVWEAPFLFCLPKSHRFADMPALLPEHIAQLDIVLVPRDYHRTHYDYQLSCLRSLGIEPRLVISDVSNIQSQMALTSAGIGSCLLSAGTVPLPQDLVLLPSIPELGRHQLGLFWSSENLHPSLRTLRNAVRTPLTG